MSHLEHLITTLENAMESKAPDGTPLEKLKFLNAELRTSPERFSSAKVWTEWNLAVHAIIERVNKIPIDLDTASEFDPTVELQVLSQCFQIARNLCAGGRNHQGSLRCVDHFFIDRSLAYRVGY
jgi:hypothetical protein